MSHRPSGERLGRSSIALDEVSLRKLDVSTGASAFKTNIHTSIAIAAADPAAVANTTPMRSRGVVG